MFGNVRNFDHGKVAVYIRWSTEEQGLGTTLAVQREACEYYCRSQGWVYNADLLYVDEGFSGATLERPALSRLRAAVAAGQVEAVVVYKLDRLSRNLLDCVTLVRQEWSGRCALYSTKENFDTESPVGQMVFNILVSFAEFERNVIRDRTQSGKRKRAEQGRNAGQVYPYGYKKGDDGNWALDGWDAQRRCFTGRAAIIRRIFAEYLSGTSARSIADKLRAEGVPAAKGGAWRYNTISALLANPAYAGRYTYGRRQGGKRAPAPLFAVDGALPPIVSPHEWEAVQRLRAQRASGAPRALGSTYLLSGLARCGKCGGTLSGAGHKPGYRYYVCTNRVFLKTCDCAYIDGNQLEAVLLAQVKKEIPLEQIRCQIGTLEADRQQQAERCSHAVSEAEEALAFIERKRKRLEQEFYAGNLDGRSLTRLSAALDAEADDARRRLAQAQAEVQGIRSTAPRAGELAALSRQVDSWAELSTAELKQVLRDLVATLTVYQQKAATRARAGNPNPIDIVWQPRLKGGRGHGGVPDPAFGAGQ